MSSPRSRWCHACHSNLLCTRAQVCVLKSWKFCIASILWFKFLDVLCVMCVRKCAKCVWCVSCGEGVVCGTCVVLWCVVGLVCSCWCVRVCVCVCLLLLKKRRTPQTNEYFSNVCYSQKIIVHCDHHPFPFPRLSTVSPLALFLYPLRLHLRRFSLIFITAFAMSPHLLHPFLHVFSHLSC